MNEKVRGEVFRHFGYFMTESTRPTPTISIQKDIKRANVPVDPALAIMARFQELSNRKSR